jgi:hypothetical protein
MFAVFHKIPKNRTHGRKMRTSGHILQQVSSAMADLGQIRLKIRSGKTVISML